MRRVKFRLYGGYKYGEIAQFLSLIQMEKNFGRKRKIKKIFIPHRHVKLIPREKRFYLQVQ